MGRQWYWIGTKICHKMELQKILEVVSGAWERMDGEGSLRKSLQSVTELCGGPVVPPCQPRGTRCKRPSKKHWRRDETLRAREKSLFLMAFSQAAKILVMTHTTMHRAIAYADQLPCLKQEKRRRRRAPSASFCRSSCMTEWYVAIA